MKAEPRELLPADVVKSWSRRSIPVLSASKFRTGPIFLPPIPVIQGHPTPCRKPARIVFLTQALSGADAPRPLRGSAPRVGKGAPLKGFWFPHRAARGGPPKKVASNFATLALATPALGEAKGAAAAAPNNQLRKRSYRLFLLFRLLCRRHSESARRSAKNHRTYSERQCARKHQRQDQGSRRHHQRAGNMEGRGAGDGFPACRTADGRTLKIADLVDDDAARRGKVINALKPHAEEQP